jgi:hypothetical protein
LFEHSGDGRPFLTSQIRLLRPFTHPAIARGMEVTFGGDWDGRDADAVIVDRLWRSDNSPALFERLAASLSGRGIRLIHALDDNLLDLEIPGEPAAAAAQRRCALEVLLRAASAVIVTTPGLRERLSSLNPRVLVARNALDDRLLPRWLPVRRPSPFGSRPLVIGYMGTRTHSADLALVAPALREVAARHRGRVRIELVGVAPSDETAKILSGVPVRETRPPADSVEYPWFCLWFTRHLRWDIAIAPLAPTPFNACKSDIKHLDYSAMGAAGIYSRAPAYEDSVIDAETGLLADDEPGAWVDALETLIADEDLRAKIARNAFGNLRRGRVLSRVAHDWRAVLSEAVA